jgi:hypothetical protein
LSSDPIGSDESSAVDIAASRCDVSTGIGHDGDRVARFKGRELELYVPRFFR